MNNFIWKILKNIFSWNFLCKRFNKLSIDNFHKMYLHRSFKINLGYLVEKSFSSLPSQMRRRCFHRIVSILKRAVSAVVPQNLASQGLTGVSQRWTPLSVSPTQTKDAVSESYHPVTTPELIRNEICGFSLPSQETQNLGRSRGMGCVSRDWLSYSIRAGLEHLRPPCLPVIPLCGLFWSCSGI